MAEVAQAELDVRIDRRANALAEKQILALAREREQLTQDVVDWQRLLGANALPDLIRELQIEPGDERRFDYALELAPEYHNTLTAGAELTLWVSGRWREQFVKTALGNPARNRIRVPVDQTTSLAVARAFEGDFVLPEGFNPEALIIELLPVAGQVSGSRQVVAWDTATGR